MKNVFVSTLLAFACTALFAQAPAASPPQRLRGSVESFDGSTLVVKERSGEVMRLVLADNFSVSEVMPIALASIETGSFIGTAAVTDAQGNLRALEVLLFPEAARGTGEGHGPWDLQPGSTMTHATVAEMVVGASGRTLKLTRDGKPTALRAAVGRDGFTPPM